MTCDFFDSFLHRRGSLRFKKVLIVCCVVPVEIDWLTGLVMDILGSALTSPSVSWSMNRSMSSSHFKRTQETKKVVEELETTGGFDRSERLNQHQNYNTNISGRLIKLKIQ